MASHHEQQASQCYGEQQHRVLWPAYNPNLPPLQASTERLFQQTRLFAPVARHCRTRPLECQRRGSMNADPTGFVSGGYFLSKLVGRPQAISDLVPDSM